MSAGPFLVAASAALGAGSAALSWAHAIGVIRSTSSDLAGLAAGLKRVPMPERPAALRDRAAEGSWERGFAEELVEAQDERWRVAAANDALSELAHTLEARAAWPNAALRIAAFGALLLGVLGFLLDHDLGWALPILAPGGVAAVLCLEAGRRARAAARARRRDVDALVDVVLGPMAREEAEKSEARRRRRRDAW
ncbi:MAG TPA: hypothetical protein VHB21_14015 [Minicystis sp.]|nr:hypothetical protein [Minicystis sp.]